MTKQKDQQDASAEDLDFNDSGFYAGDDLVPKAIKVGRVEGLVYVKKLPVVELRRFQIESASESDKIREVAGLSALAKSIRKADGSAHMTFEGAKRLRGPAVAELMRVFVEVNADSTPEEDLPAGND